eukprot:2451796-Alexandrium_andersonii.AAC.1
MQTSSCKAQEAAPACRHTVPGGARREDRAKGAPPASTRSTADTQRAPNGAGTQRLASSELGSAPPTARVRLPGNGGGDGEC